MPALGPQETYEFQKKIFDDNWNRLNEQTKKREEFAKTYTTTIIGLAYGGFLPCGRTRKHFCHRLTDRWFCCRPAC